MSFMQPGVSSRTVSSISSSFPFFFSSRFDASVSRLLSVPHSQWVSGVSVLCACRHGVRRHWLFPYLRSLVPKCRPLHCCAVVRGSCFKYIYFSSFVFSICRVRYFFPPQNVPSCILQVSSRAGELEAKQKSGQEKTISGSYGWGAW